MRRGNLELVVLLNHEIAAYIPSLNNEIASPSARKDS